MKSGNDSMHYGASHLIFKRAEELRNSCTREEEIVWTYLSGNKLGVKFRRQHPIDIFIADFYCHEIKLAIEIDGEVHLDEDVKEYDEGRTHDIEKLGVTILRFTNNEVINHRLKVITEIKNAVAELISKKADP